MMLTAVIGSTTELLTALGASTWPTPADDDTAGMGEQLRSR